MYSNRISIGTALTRFFCNLSPQLLVLSVRCNTSLRQMMPRTTSTMDT